MWVGEVEGGLGVWEEGWVNRHVLWRVVEVVVVRVVPELELGKRGGGGDGGGEGGLRGVDGG